MPPHRLLVLLLLSCAELALGDLQSEIQGIISRSDLHGGTAGVSIISPNSGESIVEIHANKSMIPASNQKLLTTGAALHVLGPSFAFQTKLIRHEDTLIIIGDGDATIGDRELHEKATWSNENAELDAELLPWINAVQQAGMTKIKSLLIDDRIFDTNFVHPSWPADQINNWYCAQVAGINYHLNVTHFYPSPRPKTRADLGEISPRMQWLTIKNQTSSRTEKNDRSSFWVARSPHSNQMTARGNVRQKHTVPVKIAFHDPPIVFGETFAELLRKNGISVGEVRRVQPGTISTGDLIFIHRTPLKYALRRSNINSHNLYAESLLKRIAASATSRPGTFDEGASTVESAVIQRLGAYQTGLNVADGSGMSRQNKISPKTLAMWLASFGLQDPVGKALLDSLATPGKGTLDNRFKNVDLQGVAVHAKSGYLRGVCSLSGYILHKDHPPLVFSIIVNDINGAVKGAKLMQEDIILAAINYLGKEYGP
jgi:D-alanyl-D-alanine carboxypeptidase/D-alanyl-D-alanine-endopeptidase (penicillin-binding protein 4)